MIENIDNNFVFVLGREQKIALEELKSVLSDFSCLPAGRVFCSSSIYRITGSLVFAKLTNFGNIEALELINKLGGTIKIYKIEGAIDKDMASQIASLFRTYKTGGEGKINFGISYYGKGFSRQNINSIALTAKKQLKGDFSLRYVESRDSADLSSILTLKNNLLTKGIEFGVFEDCIGVLVAFSNPEEWNERDYGKPASDKYSGMIPPKLARMMVNLASSEIGTRGVIPDLIRDPDLDSRWSLPDFVSGGNDKVIVMDPFCGSGNILLEAMMLGYDVIGSDNSAKAVSDSIANIDWLVNQYQVEGRKYKVLQSDATEDSLIRNLELEIRNYNGVAVVCEPYLGEPKKFKSSHSATAGEYAKVKELYIDFFKNIRNLYSSNEVRSSQPSVSNNNIVLCVVFPLIETVEGKRYSVFLEIVDELHKLGYTQIRQPLIYGRDYQVVKREIALLKFEARSSNIRNNFK